MNSAALPRERFARLRRAGRIWAVAAIHGDVERLVALHDRMAERIVPQDRLIYLGNYVGIGGNPIAVIDELLDFRRRFLALPGQFTCDLVFLRGAQEEMWSKLLQLQFAPNPTEVLSWLIEHGVGATLEAYGGDLVQARIAARDGALSTTRWTSAVRANIAARPGHIAFSSSLRRAAYSEDGGLLFVHAGIDPSRPLAAQSDSFWWASAAFARLDAPFEGFARVVRGFDTAHAGLVMAPYTASIDAGCGFGGPLMAACFSPAGELLEEISA